MNRIDTDEQPHGPHPHGQIAHMIESGALEITEPVALFLTADELAAAVRRFLAGDWGTCERDDRLSHARREGLDLLACFDEAGLRLHFLSDHERTMTRIVVAGE